MNYDKCCGNWEKKTPQLNDLTLQWQAYECKICQPVFISAKTFIFMAY